MTGRAREPIAWPPDAHAPARHRPRARSRGASERPTAHADLRARRLGRPRARRDHRGRGRRGRPPARHRKLWEFALGIQALERGGVLHEDAIGLSVGAGHEAIVYHLTNRCRWVFATDIYGSGGFTHVEGSSLMLIDPDLYAPYPYRRNRLTVSYMDALDLRFEDETFDFVVSFGSIEHFGGIGAAGRSLAEAARVLKPGGVAAVTTEFAIDGGPHASLPDLELFTQETIPHLLALAPSLRPIDGMDLAIPDNSAAPVIELGRARRIQAGDRPTPRQDERRRRRDPPGLHIDLARAPEGGRHVRAKRVAGWPVQKVLDGRFAWLARHTEALLGSRPGRPPVHDRLDTIETVERQLGGHLGLIQEHMDALAQKLEHDRAGLDAALVVVAENTRILGESISAVDPGYQIPPVERRAAADLSWSAAEFLNWRAAPTATWPRRACGSTIRCTWPTSRPGRRCEGSTSGSSRTCSSRAPWPGFRTTPACSTSAAPSRRCVSRWRRSGTG